MSENSLAAKVRARIDAEELPRNKPVETWVGYGSGRSCDGCGDSIARAEAEYKLEMPSRAYRLHTGCHGLWLGELIRRGHLTPESPRSR